MRQRLVDIGVQLLRTAPVIQQSPNPASPPHWGRRLVLLAESNSLNPLLESLKSVANSSRPVDAVVDFINAKPETIPLEAYLRGCEAASSIQSSGTIDADESTARFVLAVMSLVGAARKHEVCDSDGSVLIPHELALIGWGCAKVSLTVGSLYWARRLVEILLDEVEAYQGSAKAFFEPYRIQLVLLAREVERSYSELVAALAEDLRYSCTVETQSFRAEVAAIAWSLGMLPEAYSLHNPSDSRSAPSRRFLKQIVCQSLEHLPTDRMLQYVWLQLKDRGSFAIRDHSNLFRVINHRYKPASLIDLHLLEPPLYPEIYARQLVAWHRGDSATEETTQYLNLCSQLVPMIHMLNPRDASRIFLLGSVLADCLDPSHNTRFCQALRNCIDHYADVLKAVDFIPVSPQAVIGGGAAVFHGASAEMSSKELVDLIEQIRCAGLDYWFAVIAPRADQREREALERLLPEQESISAHLRGAFFDAIRWRLPRHYQSFNALEVDFRPPSLSELAVNARTQYHELQRRLSVLRGQMEEVSATYGKKFPDRVPGFLGLVEAINSHSVRASHA